MLFASRFWPGLRDGTLRVTFRRWKRPQVKTGGRYRTPAGRLEVDAIEEVDPATLQDADAVAAGFHNLAEMLAALDAYLPAPLYRIDFHRIEEPDPRAVLQQDDALDTDARAELDRRLDRLDKAAKRGPWTRATLRAIAEQPGVVSTVLAAECGVERMAFKADVRKLKNLGLTISLERGYELSPRGQAYLAGLA